MKAFGLDFRLFRGRWDSNFQVRTIKTITYAPETARRQPRSLRQRDSDPTFSGRRRVATRVLMTFRPRACLLTPYSGRAGRMLYESKFSTWIRSGGQSTFVLALNSLVDLETKFSVVPDRLLDSIIDDALAAAVGRLNQYLPGGVSIDISAVDLTPIRDQLRGEVAAKPSACSAATALAKRRPFRCC